MPNDNDKYTQDFYAFMENFNVQKRKKCAYYAKIYRTFTVKYIHIIKFTG